jgi:hypothetical protein
MATDEILEDLHIIKCCTCERDVWAEGSREKIATDREDSNKQRR